MAPGARELTAEQADGVQALAGALEELRLALERVRDTGLPLVAAFDELGISVPSFAGPILERALGG